MFEALKKIIAAAEELGPAHDMTVIDWSGTRGKMVFVEGITSDGLDYSMEVHLKQHDREEEAEEK